MRCEVGAEAVLSVTGSPQLLYYSLSFQYIKTGTQQVSLISIPPPPHFCCFPQLFSLHPPPGHHLRIVMIGIQSIEQFYLLMLEKSQQRQRTPCRGRSFFTDETPIDSLSYMFDPTYKNVSEKRKFEKDRKFSYFNALVKMKNNYLNGNQEIYKHVFHPEEPGRPAQKGPSDYQQPSVFHVQKINSHVFKIIKGRSKSGAHAPKFNSLGEVSFQVHVKSQVEKPKVDMKRILAEYNKMNSRGATAGRDAVERERGRRIQSQFKSSMGELGYFGPYESQRGSSTRREARPRREKIKV